MKHDLRGRRFGALVPYLHAGVRGGHSHWECLCDCGRIKVVRQSHLLTGNIKSCNAPVHRVRHGHARVGCASPTYIAWQNMLRRCRPDGADARLYYDRGIRVCARWRRFENFLTDMGERPDGRSLDRIDNDRGYEPGNCRWATASEQMRNRRSVAALGARVRELERELEEARGPRALGG